MDLFDPQQNVSSSCPHAPNPRRNGISAGFFKEIFDKFTSAQNPTFHRDFYRIILKKINFI